MDRTDAHFTIFPISPYQPVYVGSVYVALIRQGGKQHVVTSDLSEEEFKAAIARLKVAHAQRTARTLTRKRTKLR